LKVSGAGVFTITTGASTVENAFAKLKTIDLSGMTAFTAYDDALNTVVTAAGPNASTSTVTLADKVAETVILGGAKDTVVTSSTVAATDTISGFTVVASATDALVADPVRSDVLTVAGGSHTFKKFVTTASTLVGALTEAAASTDNNLIFAFGGDTYVYIDTGATGVLKDADTLVKIVGTPSIDLMVGATAAVH
jgi:hypothetical protein